MRDLTFKIKDKTLKENSLINYGFKKQDDSYFYEQKFKQGQFQVLVNLSKEKMTSKVIDLNVNEEYVLVDIDEANGAYVGKIKEEYENILNDILAKCFENHVFKSKQTQAIIEYIKTKYGDDLEYLWEKFPNNAIWRNKKNRKWYGVILVISASKLNLASEEKIEIIDLRYNKDKINELIDNQKIFGGYHMNKGSWITIKLDGSVNLNDIYDLIDNSYKLSS